MHIQFINSIQQISPAQWNALCPDGYPFIRHEFIAALELSDSTTAETGWQPQHLLIFSGAQLIAAMPGYIKTHSYGEYVFDWAWADAYRRHNLPYYPKWINAIPFTPCTGPRLLCAPGMQSGELIDRVVQTLSTYCIEHNLSGWHCLFPDDNLSEQFKQRHIPQRIGCQFHWFNHHYKSFDDFLARMNSRKRKNILKERKQVKEQGFYFSSKTGTQLTPEDWDLFYQLYRNTYLKRSGHAGYLSAQFFHSLGATMHDNLVLICAHNSTHERADNTIAAALFIRDERTIYGRYWGCMEEFQFLHFETCYYQGIEFAIAHNIERFDGGAQGEHKIARGFEPTLTYSNHWINRQDFAGAIAHFIGQEANAIKHYAEDARAMLPFKNKDE
ncbi:GNAT family N-acetyltransferase [Cellvibrio sp. pealriver]|uniref:GNAT family N-acetyltransferase n=1 Tax=Cellvibrio sp. pealriver TaxID=1622269 RepID=UPI00066FCF0D|nr:GNAT family N-acetyltransferase [Cellvibrio sp. pealriver]